MNSRLHQAALSLHAMQTADRDWLLGELDATDRMSMRALLDELAELALPADPQVLAALLLSAQSGTAAPAALRGADPGSVTQEQIIREIGEADPGLVHDLLAPEPCLLLARLLQIHPWPWERALLRALAEEKRRDIVALGLACCANTPRQTESMLTLLHLRLKQAQANLAQQPDPASSDNSGSSGSSGRILRAMRQTLWFIWQRCRDRQVSTQGAAANKTRRQEPM